MLRILVSVLFALLFSTPLLSQELHTTNKKAIQHFEVAIEYFYDYGDIEIAEFRLKEALDKDAEFLEAKIMLAEVYLATQRQDDALNLLFEVIDADPTADAQVSLVVANLLLSQGRYEEAKPHFVRFLNMNPERNRDKYVASIGAASCDFAIESMANPIEFNPKNMGENINSEYPEYFPTMTADETEFIFTRRIPNSQSYNGIDEDFFYSFYKNGAWTVANNPGPPVNSPLREGAPALSPDGRYLFFTVCAFEGYYGRGRTGFGSCDIFVSLNEGGVWGLPKNMGKRINSRNWETQPTFSSDGKTLYFIRGNLTRTGVSGQDIYYSELTDKGWSSAQPLSDVINTPEAESSVFIHPDSKTLYFSSRGHVGMGGADIYRSIKQPDGSWSKPENLGYPLNTHNDENSFLVSASGEYAIMASDRAGGLGDLDLYQFDLPEALKPTPTTFLKGKITDAQTGKPLEAEFELIDLASGDTVVHSYSDPSDGSFLVVLPLSDEYALLVDKEAYLFHSENFQLDRTKKLEQYRKDIELNPISVGTSIVLKNIFFDTDKFDLKSASYVELRKLLNLLNSNPEARIEIGGHTDSEGDDQSNQILSENRAKAVYSYLVNEGIAADRLTYVGYGETRPIASNDNAEGRAQNRRTEFTVIE